MRCPTVFALIVLMTAGVCDVRAAERSVVPLSAYAQAPEVLHGASAPGEPVIHDDEVAAPLSFDGLQPGDQVRVYVQLDRAHVVTGQVAALNGRELLLIRSGDQKRLPLDRDTITRLLYRRPTNGRVWRYATYGAGFGLAISTAVVLAHPDIDGFSTEPGAEGVSIGTLLGLTSMGAIAGAFVGTLTQASDRWVDVPVRPSMGYSVHDGVWRLALERRF